MKMMHKSPRNVIFLEQQQQRHSLQKENEFLVEAIKPLRSYLSLHCGLLDILLNIL